MSPIWLLPITALAVFLKTFQQLNVAKDGHWFLVPPTSYGMAFTEVFIISAVVTAGASLETVLWMGTGGWIGCFIAKAVHPQRNQTDVSGSISRIVRIIRGLSK